MNQLKTIPADGSPFTANGKTYYQEDGLSIDRWLMMQNLTIQLGFGVSYEEMQKNWLNMKGFMNDMNFVDGAVMCHNMVNGISKVYSREPMILKFCALFMNTENENRGTITEDQISIKIKDFTEEGLGIDGFFAFSLLKVKGMAESYQKAIQNISQITGAVNFQQGMNQEPQD